MASAFLRLCGIYATHGKPMQVFFYGMAFKYPLHFACMSLVPENYSLDKKVLGRALRELRDGDVVSIRELAKIAGLDFSHLSKIELGRTEVSLGKFLRICYALQVPPGRILEGCAVVGQWIYEAKFYNDDDVKEWAKVGGILDEEKRKMVSDFLTGTALALSYILKSSNPVLMLEHLDFPVPSQKADFITFAAEQLPQLGPANRRAVLHHIITGGWSVLEQLGLVNDRQVEAYLADANHKKSRWIPAPRIPFFQVESCKTNAMEAQVALLVSMGKEKLESLATKNKTRKRFTNTETLSSLDSVNNLWPQLKKRIQLATAKPGKKSELAKFLKVDLSRVSQWLTDRKTYAREPGAEYALQMQHWVSDPQRK